MTIKKVFAAVFALTILSFAGSCGQTVSVSEDEKPVVVENESIVEPDRLLRHVVLFRFKENASPDSIKIVEDAFANLPSQITAIYSFEWGKDVSVENLTDGFTHCFVVSFLSEDDRAVYLPHPAHKEFTQLLPSVLDKPLVLDYWAEN